MLLLLLVLIDLLLLNNLVHEGRLVDASRGIEAWGALAISLELVLRTHRNRTIDRQMMGQRHANWARSAGIIEVGFKLRGGTYSW